ncbi:hypothetical protein [Flavobacterium sp. 3HN19-14]|uniref:hypothetical protein n=1 Tax=Flavobacterium sp. 3HN19-14 TaxID=3448133 RepID=UPI003EDEC5B8
MKRFIELSNKIAKFFDFIDAVSVGYKAFNSHLEKSKSAEGETIKVVENGE